MNNRSSSLSNENNQPRFSYGYVIILGSFLVLVISWGAQYSFGVFLKPLLDEFGWTRAATSGAYSLNMVLMGIFAVIAGRLNDRFGPRVVLMVCGLIIGVGYLLMSRVSAIWQIYLVFGVLLSIGMSGVFVPLMSNLARWFSRRRGLASGMVASGIGVGILVTPPLANLLISRYGWQTSYIIVGSIALVFITLIAQFLKRDPNQHRVLTPNDNISGANRQVLQFSGLTLQKALRTRQFWVIFAMFLLFVFGHQMIMVHIVLYATDIRIPVSSAATILSVIGIASIVGKIAFGSVGDRIGNRKVMTIVIILISVSYLWLLLARELWMLYLFAIVFSLGYGGSASVQSPLVADFFGLKAHGAIFGLISFANSIGGALGPLVGGYIFDVSSSYQWAFTLCAMLGIAALILSVSLKRVKKQDVASV